MQRTYTCTYICTLLVLNRYFRVGIYILLCGKILGRFVIKNTYVIGQLFCHRVVYMYTYMQRYVTCQLSALWTFARAVTVSLKRERCSSLKDLTKFPSPALSLHRLCGSRDWTRWTVQTLTCWRCSWCTGPRTRLWNIWKAFTCTCAISTYKNIC